MVNGSHNTVRKIWFLKICYILLCQLHCKCSGCWKVYGDVEQAQRLFARYRKCTDIYCELWRAGSGIGQLAVAV